MFDPLDGRQTREANYILYFLDERGRIRGAEWLAAIDDSDALAQVRRMAAERECELWQRARKVARLPAPDPLQESSCAARPQKAGRTMSASTAL
jgi:hypothetical protein